MNEQTRNEIIARFGQGHSMRSIARTLGVSRGAVSRAVHGHQAGREAGADGPSELRPRRRHRSLLDPFTDTIGQLLDRYPNITVERLLQELRKEDYPGSYTNPQVRPG